MKTNIFSIYMQNIPDEVIGMQRQCVLSVLPKDWQFFQHLHIPTKNERYPHAAALANCLNSNSNPEDVTIFLDIDCIPLSIKALEFIAINASQGALTGAVQRANHISNGAHLYVGPFCMAFSKVSYKEIGSPPFIETARGDVGEELTYRWQDRKKPVCFLWPSQTHQPKWDLDYGFKFGFGTTYGTALVSPHMFYHAFNAREPEMQKLFVSKCQMVLDENKNRSAA